MTFTTPRMRFGIAAALFALLALALAAFSSADPLGKITLYKEGLREPAFVKQLTPGPDGNVWFVDNKAFSENSAIGRITPSGEIKEFLQSAERDLVAIVAGPKSEKYLWFTDKGATPAIGKVDSANPETTVEFSIQGKGGNAGSLPQGIAVGPEGNLWFADAGTTPAIGVFNPETEVVKECSAGLNEGSQPHGIVAGPDGNLWFTDGGTTKGIGRINPGTCEIKEFATGANSEPGGSSGLIGPWGIAAGPDGNVWFTENGTNKTNSPTGKAIGRITPSGTITYFSEGLSSSSRPFGLTVANGKLWFADASHVEEQQEIEVKATENLGGTYRLGFEGKETGWTGSGNLSDGGAGTGDVVRYPVSGTLNCTSTSGSKELKSCGAELLAKAEVGMRIVKTGLPAKTMIEKVEGGVIFTTLAATATSTTSTTEGWVKNVSTTAGEFKVGQALTSSSGSPSNSAIIACTPSCASPTAITTEAVPTAAGIKTGATIEAGSKTVSSVTTSTGTASKGETISGEGIQAGTTITNCSPSCTSPTSLTLSKVTVKAGTGVSLSADLGFGAEASAIQGALEALSTIGKNKFELPNVAVSGTGNVSPVKRFVTFESEFGAKDVSQLTCNASGLTGTGASCGVTTTAAGKPNAIGSITTSGTITRYEKEQLLWGIEPITTGPDGNVWCASGLTVVLSICKFGIEPEGPTNLRKLTLTKSAGGTGGIGTVQSKPKGIKCGPPCSEAVAELYENSTVVLKAKASTGSTIAGWSGCDSFTGVGGIEGTCTVEIDDEVEGEHDEYSVGITWTGTSKAILNPQALTVSKGKSSGKGTVKGTGGLGCETECTKTTVLYQGETGVEPKIKPGKTVVLKAASAFGSEFSGFSPNCTEITPTECSVVMNEAEEVTAEFTAKPTTTLTVDKAGAGTGTVSSKPKAINCGATCTTQDATVPTEEAVILKEKPGTGMTFTGWSGGGCSGTAETCTVKLSEATTVTATFSGAPKAIPNAKEVTLTKAGNGYGTVKAAGLTCEALCTSTVSLYEGETGVEPKIKPGKTVIFKALSAPGSKTVEWSGCTEINPTECSVTVMNEDIEVTAKFDELK